MKPAAIPMMDAGKAFARSGELLIDAATNEMDDLEYGSPLANAGASFRNAGDHMAQAAASCRFKTGLELVSDELRESAWCLVDAATKIEQQADLVRTEDSDEFVAALGEFGTFICIYICGCA